MTAIKEEIMKSILKAFALCGLILTPGTGVAEVGEADHCVIVSEIHGSEKDYCATEGESKSANLGVTNTCSRIIYLRHRDRTGRVVDNIVLPQELVDAHLSSDLRGEPGGMMNVPCRLQGRMVETDYVYCADFASDFEPELDAQHGFAAIWSGDEQDQYLEEYLVHMAKSDCYKSITSDPVPDYEHFEGFRVFVIKRSGVTWGLREDDLPK